MKEGGRRDIRERGGRGGGSKQVEEERGGEGGVETRRVLYCVVLYCKVLLGEDVCVK